MSEATSAAGPTLPTARTAAGDWAATDLSLRVASVTPRHQLAELGGASAIIDLQFASADHKAEAALQAWSEAAGKESLARLFAVRKQWSEGSAAYQEYVRLGQALNAAHDQRQAAEKLAADAMRAAGALLRRGEDPAGQEDTARKARTDQEVFANRLAALEPLVEAAEKQAAQECREHLLAARQQHLDAAAERMQEAGLAALRALMNGPLKAMIEKRAAWLALEPQGGQGQRALIDDLVSIPHYGG